jgi:uncharacterized protein YjbI with pentapeptide repeats
MSEPDGTESSTKQHISRKANITNRENSKQAPTVPRPINDDTEAWTAYWMSLSQPWRRESEIDAERQVFLIERRTIVPDIEKGMYPFSGITLSRADVEWLLATHDNGRGPVEWSYDFQHKGEGLDLRGALLQYVDLHRLPLACMRGGLNQQEWINATLEQRNWAGVHLEQSNLYLADLRGAFLSKAHLEESNLREAHLEGANLYRAHLQGVYLRKTYMGGASLRHTIFDSNTIFDDVFLEDEKLGCALLADINWNGMNITNVHWMQIKMLGDDFTALQLKQRKAEVAVQIRTYQRAVRANRQLAATLQGQGLNEEAARFAYHAQRLQRSVLWRRKKFGQYLFSGFLDLLAGYGYRPGRSVIWYLATIFVFTLTYFAIGHLPFFPDAFVFSLTSFHGRGFFPGLGSASTLHNPLVVIAAFEAVIGLVIEISFIATFTQRFFGK